MPLFVALGVVASLCIGALALSTASRKPRSRPPAPPVAQAIATETRLAEPAESPAVLPQPATPTVDAGLPPPQKPTPATELKVTIDSRPAVDLTIDGTTVGRTPWSGLLALGSHKLKLENRDLLINASRTLTVQGTEPLTQSYEFAKGTVAVNAPAGAAILVDGKKLGVAPLQNDLSLYEGFHRIVVKVGQAQWTESFSLYEGQRVSFNVELE
jgi:serine/threonine-protein kinase